MTYTSSGPDGVKVTGRTAGYSDCRVLLNKVDADSVEPVMELGIGHGQEVHEAPQGLAGLFSGIRTNTGDDSGIFDGPLYQAPPGLTSLLRRG